jgi:CBS domain-containing protein
MNVGEICSKNVVYVLKQDSVVDVARIMREKEVGTVVVVDNINDVIMPLGLITDHDLVLEVLAANIAPSLLKAEDILTCELYCLTEIHDVRKALKYLRYYGVRSAPVVNAKGVLVGLFSIEGALVKLSAEFSGLIKSLSEELTNKKNKIRNNTVFRN